MLQQKRAEPSSFPIRKWETTNPWLLKLTSRVTIVTLSGGEETREAGFQCNSCLALLGGNSDSASNVMKHFKRKTTSECTTAFARLQEEAKRTQGIEAESIPPPPLPQEEQADLLKRLEDFLIANELPMFIVGDPYFLHLMAGVHSCVFTFNITCRSLLFFCS
eukprot:GHVU01192347.1.p1 GENE.GHVU01192347.1~~GHVU01192347.1.p1  ORF type:complete len:163 (-),score=18.31 GHVU01192347.1:609-1097(-)